MKIPKELKIGERTYRIKNNALFVVMFNKQVIGNINYNNNTMTLKVASDERDKECTFFHEIAHGILHEMEFNHPKIHKFTSDEVFVNELGLNMRKTFLDLLKKQGA